MKVTIIGSGNMGGAIARGLSKGSIVKAEDITCTDYSQKTLDKLNAEIPELHTLLDNAEACRNADIIFLAVKPWIIEEVIYDIRHAVKCEKQIIVSIAAGLTFEQLTSYLEKDFPILFRVIPNTAIEIQSSMTLISACNANDEQTKMILAIFNELGKALLIEERLMAAATALASCGLAYAMRYIRAATEGGVELGFYPHEAQEIVLQTVKGAAELLLANKNHPEAEIDKVTTPGGITIKGLNAMEHAGFTSAVIQGLKASK